MEQSRCLYHQKELSIPYHHTEAVHNLVAPRVVASLVMQIIQPKSVLDVGCGTGTWLKAFEELGIKDYLGVDGDYLDKNLLKIPIDHFAVHDLQQSFSLQRKFDLVISLEVAEHVGEKYADQFVQSLVTHGDAILFSGAIPGQGGQNHMNEQWPDYWRQKFERHSFYFHDALRPLIWNNANVEWWYKQNIFLVRKGVPSSNGFKLLAMVHPELYTLKLRNEQEYLQSLVNGKQGVWFSARIFMNALRFKLKNLLGGK